MMIIFIFLKTEYEHYSPFTVSNKKITAQLNNYLDVKLQSKYHRSTDVEIIVKKDRSKNKKR